MNCKLRKLKIASVTSVAVAMYIVQLDSLQYLEVLASAASLALTASGFGFPAPSRDPRMCRRLTSDQEPQELYRSLMMRMSIRVSGASLSCWSVTAVVLAEASIVMG